MVYYVFVVQFYIANVLKSGPAWDSVMHGIPCCFHQSRLVRGLAEPGEPQLGLGLLTG